jgi:hypothetical protein
MTKPKTKPKPRPWSTEALDYSKRANWPKVAEEMLLEQPALPSTWGYDDLESRVWLDEKFGFDAAYWPKLRRYLVERLPVLVLRLDSSKADSEGARP